MLKIAQRGRLWSVTKPSWLDTLLIVTKYPEMKGQHTQASRWGRKHFERKTWKRLSKRRNSLRGSSSTCVTKRTCEEKHFSGSESLTFVVLPYFPLTNQNKHACMCLCFSFADSCMWFLHFS
jgi:hypothetical protein